MMRLLSIKQDGKNLISYLITIICSGVMRYRGVMEIIRGHFSRSLRSGPWAEERLGKREH